MGYADKFQAQLQQSVDSLLLKSTILYCPLQCRTVQCTVQYAVVPLAVNSIINFIQQEYNLIRTVINSNCI